MLTLAEIALRAHATACEKGWHDRPMRTYRVNVESREYYEINHDAVLRSHALIHSEISEAIDELHAGRLDLRIEDGKPEGLVVELADVVIRICDTMQALGLACDPSVDAQWWTASQQVMAGRTSISGDYIRNAFDLARTHVDKATEAARVDAWIECTNHYSSIVAAVATVAAVFTLNLPAAIEAKMAYNATRPTRHGGKRA
jgi:hypothetical protein